MESAHTINGESIKKKNYRLLLISNMNTKPNHIPLNSKKENLYDTLKNSNLFSEIKIVSIESIPKFTELALLYNI